VQYRDDDFLPFMKELEPHMARCDGPGLPLIMPQLKPGEKRVIPYFHDECCMHANDAVQSGW
jgi:hypothetical protein